MQDASNPVYIIDDDASVCKALCRLMRSADFTPRAFESGEDFLSQEDIEPCAWVICDLCMPGIDGMEIYRRVEHRHSDPAFVFISALADGRDVEEARRVGRAFFQKPVDADDLLGVLRK